MTIRLRYWRRKRGMTQTELADKAKVHAATIVNIETKPTYEPYPSTLRRLAEALGVSYEELVIVEDEDELLARI